MLSFIRLGLVMVSVHSSKTLSKTEVVCEWLVLQLVIQLRGHWILQTLTLSSDEFLAVWASRRWTLRL